MKIVLVGLMGSGKSAVGRLLAERLDRPFLDTDALVEAEAGRSVADIFRTEGEAAFREREAGVIAALRSRTDLVVATGGGAVLRPENRAALRQGALVIWLDAPPETLYKRAAAQGIERRPLLNGPEPLARLAALAAERAGAYAAAAHARVQTDGRSPAEVVAEILALYTAGGGVKGHG